MYSDKCLWSNGSAARAEAEVDLTLTLPPDLPAGYYRPFLAFQLSRICLAEHPPSRSSTLRIIHLCGPGFAVDEAHLPIIRVGNPAPPRLYWPLSAWIRSATDRAESWQWKTPTASGVAQRVLTSSDTFVIPRLERGLRPAAPLSPRTVCPHRRTRANGSGDEIPSSAPSFPFQFPSGSLTVTIRQPDGTERMPWDPPRSCSPGSRASWMTKGILLR